jgi:hypothetical protein
VIENASRLEGLPLAPARRRNATLVQCPRDPVDAADAAGLIASMTGSRSVARVAALDRLGRLLPGKFDVLEARKNAGGRFGQGSAPLPVIGGLIIMKENTQPGNESSRRPPRSSPCRSRGGWDGCRRNGSKWPQPQGERPLDKPDYRIGDRRGVAAGGIIEPA